MYVRARDEALFRRGGGGGGGVGAFDLKNIL